jgi:hypothetical protein
LAVFLVAGIFSSPSQCLAKTRPPIEMGDPDDTNEKPRPATRHVLALETSIVRTSSFSSVPSSLEDIPMMIRAYLRAWRFLR